MEVSLFRVISGLPRTYRHSNSRRKTMPSNKPLVPLLTPPKPNPIRLEQFPNKKEEEQLQQQQQQSRNTSTSIATDVLRLMDTLRLPITEDIYVCLLKECTDSRSSLDGAQVHAHINCAGFRPGIHLKNRILLMYAACGCLVEAHQVFDKMSVRNLISWAIIIMVNIESNKQEEALKLFAEMNEKGVKPTVLILVHILKACCSFGDFDLGKQVHGWVLKMGMVVNIRDVFLGSSFVDFYGKSGCLESARRVFYQMHRQNTVAWTSMIVGYGREDRFKEALEVFKEMGRAGKKKNNFTFSSVLRACGRIGDNGQRGQQIHANAIKVGVESDPFVGSSLIDMYGKCGLFRDAREVFEMMSERNAVCWNAMLNAYTQNGCCIEAVKLLYDMKAAGVEPQESMVNEVRVACGGLNCSFCH